MNDLGNDTAMAALKMAEKTTEEIINLIKFLLTSKQRMIENKYKNAITEEKSFVASQKKLIRELDNSSGFVNANKLLQSGDKIITLASRFSDEDLKQLEFYAKKYGVVISSISDETLTGTKDRIVLVREKDLPFIKDITDRIAEATILNKINQRIDEITAKGDQATPEELLELNTLINKKEETLRKSVKLFNDEAESEIFKDIFDKLEDKSVTFERALNRFTDRDFSKDVPYYICERGNPNNFIEMTSTLDTFRGKEYTKTFYNIYKDNQPVGSFDDGRFEGRSKSYWADLRVTMKMAGDFSDDIVIFNDWNDLSKYQHLYHEMSESVKPHIIDYIDSATNESLKDYSDVILDLKGKFNALNIEVSFDDSNNPVFKNLLSNDIINVDECSEHVKVNISQAYNISAQIENYTRLNDVQLNISIKTEKINELNLEVNKIKELIVSQPNLEPIILKSMSGQIETINNQIETLNIEINQNKTIFKELEVETNKLYNNELRLNSINIINSMEDDYLNDHTEHASLFEVDFDDHFIFTEPEIFTDNFDAPEPMFLDEWKNLLVERKNIDSLESNIDVKIPLIKGNEIER